jgi:hypothetical protein
LQVRDINTVLKSNGMCLYPAYLELSGVVGKALRQKKSSTKYQQGLLHHEIDATIEGEHDPHRKEALREFKAAQLAVETQIAKAEAEKQREQEELDNFNQATAEGTVGECGCCFDDFALNRMVHCNAEIIHWFCRDCARRQTESQIGLSKFDLNCMSMDGCTGGFSPDQRDIFLDENLATALERIEQEAVLRLAGIENLETCPFCPFAAEYPPIEVNKEFRCQKPDCEIVSCRLCRRETHIPKSCQEAALEDGHSARRVIEEAMSAAMIRKCNKCKSDIHLLFVWTLSWLTRTACQVVLLSSRRVVATRWCALVEDVGMSNAMCAANPANITTSTTLSAAERKATAPFSTMSRSDTRMKCGRPRRKPAIRWLGRIRMLMLRYSRSGYRTRSRKTKSGGKRPRLLHTKDTPGEWRYGE